MSLLDFLRPKPMESITALELSTRLKHGDRPVILDVRTPDEFRAGHIPGAHLIPLNQLAARVGELDRNQEIVLVCHSGGRSSTAYRMLDQFEFDRLRNLTGGMVAWSNSVR